MRAQIGAEVIAISGANGVAARELDPVVFSYKDPHRKYNPIITVTARRTVPLLFAGVLGPSSHSVSVQATSIVGKVSPMGLWPWGVTENAIVPGALTALKIGAQQSVDGNFGALDFSGTDTKDGGAIAYEHYIRNRFWDVPRDPIPPESWWVATEPGNKVGPTRDAVQSILSQPACPYGIDIRCPRIAVVPVLPKGEWESVNGKDQVEVVGFAVFRLESFEVDGGQGHDTVYGTFLTWAKAVGGVMVFDTELNGLVGARLWR